jgi:hypothetical protein
MTSKNATTAHTDTLFNPEYHPDFPDGVTPARMAISKDLFPWKSIQGKPI